LLLVLEILTKHGRGLLLFAAPRTTAVDGCIPINILSS